uniref:Uncharacterized protein n=1 Tax=Hyaloperonospora arabidopsidis (strain Emoy2) TaxID=559515 RepID=M4BIL7_HYAAE
MQRIKYLGTKILRMIGSSLRKDKVYQLLAVRNLRRASASPKSQRILAAWRTWMKRRWANREDGRSGSDRNMADRLATRRLLLCSASGTSHSVFM